MGICCASYCRDNESSIGNANSFSSNVPVVSETTRYYQAYQENLRKTRQNASQSGSTTRNSNQSNLKLPGNKHGSSQKLINKPIIITPEARSRRHLNTNFNTNRQVEASTLNRNNLISIINDNRQNNLQRKDSPKIFGRENIEEDTTINQTKFLKGLNNSRLESIKKGTNFLERLIQQKVVRSLKLINDLRAAFNLNHLETLPGNSYQEENLEALKYAEVANFFTVSNKPHFTISKITDVKNIFLELHFMLNVEIYRKRNPEQLVDDNLLFHGTKLEFLNKICTYNFDRTKVCTHKFGHGVSFATHSFYATHYHHDNKRKYQKVMIIARVLMEKKLPLGTDNTVVPPEPFYTSRNGDATVIVKYDDASFYPLFIVYYSGFNKYNSHKRH